MTRTGPPEGASAGRGAGGARDAVSEEDRMASASAALEERPRSGEVMGEAPRATAPREGGAEPLARGPVADDAAAELGQARAEGSTGLSAASASAGSVVVLMALHQGAAHLDAQLASIAAQEGGPPPVIVSDDGSTDAGPAIVGRHAVRGPAEVRLIDGPRGGAAANFLHLLREAGPDVPHVALSDQDDVWLPGKTARALVALAEAPPGVPAVHCGRTMICDAEGRALRPSILHPRPPSFRNALVQSLAGGNTMTLNRAALDLVQAAAGDLAAAGLPIVVHDWWIYQIVSGAGGRMIYDPEPLLLYRQHGANAIGENTTARALARRAAMVMGGRFRAWSEVNLAALGASRHRLTPDAREALDGFAAMRRMARPSRRVAALRRLGLYRQTRVADAALRVAAALGRL